MQFGVITRETGCPRPFSGSALSDGRSVSQVNCVCTETTREGIFIGGPRPHPLSDPALQVLCKFASSHAAPSFSHMKHRPQWSRKSNARETTHRAAWWRGHESPLHTSPRYRRPSFACGGYPRAPLFFFVRLRRAFAQTKHHHPQPQKTQPAWACAFLLSTFVHVPPSQRRHHAGRHPPLPRHMSPYVPWVPAVVAGSPSMIYTGVYSDIYRPTVPVIWTPGPLSLQSHRRRGWVADRGSEVRGHAGEREEDAALPPAG